MRKLIALLLAFSTTAQAAGPFIWGADSMAQGLQSGGILLSSRQAIDYNGFTNRILNQAGVDTTGWSTYDDAAAAPADCTGGSVSETWTSSTSSPLRGNRSFVLSKDAANRQGEGAVYDFTIDTADTSKPMQIGFDVSINDTDYTAGDLLVYVYDVTNAVVLTPSVQSIAGAAYRFNSVFNASSSTSYRLCVHTATTGAGAWDAKFDDFFVGPQLAVKGMPALENVTWTPTGSWVSNTTYTGKYSRFGNWAAVSVKVATSNAPTSATLTITTSGIGTIDTSALTDTGAALGSLLSTGEASDSGTSYKVHAKYSSTTAVTIAYQSNTSGAESNVTQAAPFTFGATDYVDVKFWIPIAEWAGSASYLSAGAPEYAYNTSTSTTTSDTSSFAYGPAGALIQNITSVSGLNRRVRFLTPIQPTDDIFIEISVDQIRWARLGCAVSNGAAVEGGMRFDGSDTFGMGIDVANVGSNTTDVEVLFGSKRTGSKAWSAASVGSTTYWRAVKVPGMVQSATPFTTGQIPGVVDSTVASAGSVGENKSQTRVLSAATSLSNNTDTNITSTALTLTPGEWEIWGSVLFVPAATTTVTRLTAAIATTSATLPGTDTESVQDSNGQIRIEWSQASAAPAANISINIPRVTVNIAASTTYYLVGRSTFATSTMTVAGGIYAKRVR